MKKITRRELLKYGAIASGAVLASTKGPIPRSFADNTFHSPPTTPFRDPLPVPATAQASFTRFADLDLPDRDKAAFVDFSPNQQRTKFYTIRAVERSVFVHKDFEDRGLATSIWGYVDDRSTFDQNTPAPGPTFMTRMTTDPLAGNIVRVINGLSPNAQGFGTPHLTTHLHGGHQPSRSDGFPGKAFRLDGTVFDPVIQPGGGHYDYTYPNLDAGFFSATADPTDRPSTLWYHDHIVDFTGPNVYRGLAAFHLVFDELDTGDETTGVHLPSGAHDVPLLIQDKMFGPDASLVFDPFNTDGFLGDKYLVNGTIQPFFEVQRRRYRFRFLNGSVARFYQMFLTNSAGKTFPMAVVATEGGLLSSTQNPVQSFLIAPAERYEVVVDFSMFRPGDKVYFENRLAQDSGRGPEGTFEQPGLLPSGTRMLELRVGDAAPDASANFYQPGLPLRPFSAISRAELNAVTTFRTFEFNRSEGAWTVNGNLFDLNRSDAQPFLNQGEIWRVVNKSGGWWHPNHVHLQVGRVLKRNGRTPPVFERDGIAKKDTVILGPGSELEVFVRFQDYPGPFVAHCHNLTHEDMAMMFRFDPQAQSGQNFI